MPWWQFIPYLTCWEIWSLRDTVIRFMSLKTGTWWQCRERCQSEQCLEHGTFWSLASAPKDLGIMPCVEILPFTQSPNGKLGFPFSFPCAAEVWRLRSLEGLASSRWTLRASWILQIWPRDWTYLPPLNFWILAEDCTGSSLSCALLPGLQDFVLLNTVFNTTQQTFFFLILTNVNYKSFHSYI